MIFLPVVFFIYWFACKKLKWQNLFILLASYIFYGWWDWRFLILIAITSFSSYLSGLFIQQYEGNRKAQRAVCVTNAVVNLGILAMFKYFGFFMDSLNALLTGLGVTMDWPTVNIILPVGISFYTFQALSYSIDVYKDKIKPTRDIVAFFGYISFFPQLVAGPIERATNLLPQILKKRAFDYSTAVDGLRQMLWGFFKKLIIADTCAEVVNPIWDNIEGQSGISLFLGLALFAFQIYADFSGYSDIAIGSAKLFGIKLSDNFRVPFLSRNMREFWRRWHISLIGWFTQYVYYPLGGSRCSQSRNILNVLIVFTLSGLWHGASWTYVLWGFYNGLLFIPLILLPSQHYRDTVAHGRYLPTVRELFSMILTFVLFILGLIMFRAPDFQHIVDYCHQMFSLSFFGRQGLTMKMATTLLWCAGLTLVEWVQREKQHVLQIDGYRIFGSSAVRLSLYAILVCLIFYFAGQVQTFIYFQF